MACDTLAQTAGVLLVMTSLGKARVNEWQGTILCCWTGERDYSNLSHVQMSFTSPALQKLSARFRKVQEFQTAFWRCTATTWLILTFCDSSNNLISTSQFQVDCTNEEVT